MLDGVAELLIVFVKAVLLVAQLIERLVGVHSEEGTGQRQAVFCRHRVPCLFSQK